MSEIPTAQEIVGRARWRRCCAAARQRPKSCAAGALQRGYGNARLGLDATKLI